MRSSINTKEYRSIDLGYFIVDGYNLLFAWSDENQSLQIRRSHLIAWIQRMNVKGTIVFDGAHRRDEESGLSYASPMEVAYTPKGQSADHYILELIELSKNKRDLVLVTNDQLLKRNAKAYGVKHLSIQAFQHLLEKRKKKKKSKKPPIRESSSEMKRLLKIFEERLIKELES